GAEQTQAQGGGTSSTTARLHFDLAIDRMIYLRVGHGPSHAGTPSGAGPLRSRVISTAELTLAPANIPGSATPPVNGSQQGANWNGSAPVYASSTAVLPVEVRSNAGQVRIVAQTSGPAINTAPGGPHPLPMSRFALTSDNASLPAPPIPNTGSGAAVLVAPGGAGTGAAPGLLTYRTANWTFQLTPSGSPVHAGVYTGQIT